MKHLTGTERLLIVAIVLLVLIGAVVRYSRARRDAPDLPPGGGDGTATTTEHATRTRTD